VSPRRTQKEEQEVANEMGEGGNRREVPAEMDRGEEGGEGPRERAEREGEGAPHSPREARQLGHRIPCTRPCGVDRDGMEGDVRSGHAGWPADSCEVRELPLPWSGAPQGRHHPESDTSNHALQFFLASSAGRLGTALSLCLACRPARGLPSAPRDP